MVEWTGAEPYFEAASDMLAGDSWRTPGINPNDETTESNADKGDGDNWVIYGGLFDRSADEYTNEEYEAAKKENPIITTISERLGLLRPKSEAKSEQGIIGGTLTRVAFILIGLVFLTVALVMISRPVQAGVVEGIKEGLSE